MFFRFHLFISIFKQHSFSAGNTCRQYPLASFWRQVIKKEQDSSNRTLVGNLRYVGGKTQNEAQKVNWIFGRYLVSMSMALSLGQTIVSVIYKLTWNGSSRQNQIKDYDFVKWKKCKVVTFCTPYSSASRENNKLLFLHYPSCIFLTCYVEIRKKSIEKLLSLWRWIWRCADNECDGNKSPLN